MRRLLAAFVVLLTALATLAGTVAPASAAGPPAAEVVARGDTASPPRIALTFDAGSDTGFAARVLDTLSSKGVKAGFGLTGLWAEQNPALVQRMVAEGHQLINHTYDHQSFTGRSTGRPPLTQAQRWDELDRADAVIQSITGRSTKPWWRPPYGDYDTGVLTDVAARGYGTQVMWTTDSLGWNGLTTQQIVDRVLGQAVPGGIVLFHLGSASHDADALPTIIDQLRARGYALVTVADIMPWRPFPNARSLAAQQYPDFLNRAPAQAEVDYWAGRLLARTITPSGLIGSFYGSAEYQRTVPPVARLYTCYLLRIPDPGGLQYWAERIRQGSSLTAIADSMLTLPELQARYSAMDDTQFVTSLYQTALGREPDSGGLGYWVDQLAAHRVTRGGVMVSLSESQESVTRSSQQVSVIAIYIAMLRRSPDPDGLAYWTAYLRTHPIGDLILLLLQSPEYRARF